MKRIYFTLIATLFCAGLSAQSLDAAATGVQPEFGFVLDGIATSHEGDGTNADLKMAELSISSRIDPLARAFAIIEFPGVDAVDVPEAVLIFDGLGDGWEVRAGRMNMDLGKWNTVHGHDMAMPFGDPVRSGLFGGHLNGTGLEIHKWFALADVPVRFSVGAWAGAGAHDHEESAEGDSHEHAGFSSGVEGQQNLDDWAFSGRLASQRDFGDNGWWQWGLSYFGSTQGMASDWKNEEEDSGDPNSLFASGQAFGLGVQTLGFDLSISDASLDADSWNRASFEYWHHAQDHAHAEGDAEVFTVERAEPLGAWLVAEHGFSSEWSFGGHAGWWEAEVDESLESVLRYGVAVNRHFSEFNRLRVALEKIDEPFVEAEWLLTFQWSLFMGKHRHGMDW